MLQQSNRSSRAVSVGAFMIVASLVVAATATSKTAAAEGEESRVKLAFDAKANCVQIASWVEQHANELPSSLTELSGYPTGYRRAIVAELPIAVRVSLWSDHIRQESESMELSVEQQLFVEGVVQELPRYLSGNEVDREALEQLRRDAQAVLDFGNARTLLTTLGSKYEAPRWWPALVEPGVTEPLTIDCSCSGQSDWCDSGAGCVMGGCNTNGGCGTFWVYNCDGLCNRAE